MAYNAMFVWGMFIWLFGVDFLPFPTELLSAAAPSGRGVHALYIGTLLVASVGQLVQQAAIVYWPALQVERHRGEAKIALAVISGLVVQHQGGPIIG